ncbi:MAG: PEP-CTERM sorting domain-containing protein [Luteolibacter sp.]
MSTSRSRLLPIAASLAAALGVSSVQAATSVFSAAGATPASIQGTVASFQTALGTLNPNNGSSFASGRREINWDAVPDGSSSPNALPGNFFAQSFNGSNGGRTRGASFSTPSGGFLVSPNNPGPASANALFVQDLAGSDVSFPAFSNDQIFIATTSTITDVTFVVPGTASDLAFVRSFGVVFLNVGLANTTSLEFFNLNNVSLGSHFAPVSGAGGLSFLGVDFDDGETIGRVRITAGSETFSAFNPGSDLRESTGNLVAMDDFIYSEPLAIPEPSASALAGLAVLGCTLRRRRRNA